MHTAQPQLVTQFIVYYRTMFEGKPRTAFLSCQALPNGTASGILSSYKRAFTAAGSEVTDWIPKLVWYCADGATGMQGRQEGVYALLRDLQQEICGWSVVVPIHANCHRTDLAIKAALSAGHVFVDVVANSLVNISVTDVVVPPAGFQHQAADDAGAAVISQGMTPACRKKNCDCDCCLVNISVTGGYQ